MTRLLLLSLFCMLNSMLLAQDWNLHWIHAPHRCSTEQLWFRQTYQLSAKPQKAVVEMASCGRLILYINGRNVTTRIFEPARQPQGDTIFVVRYDVEPFLQRGANSIAVWFSPLPGPDGHPTDSRKQLSLELSGTIAGKKFAHFTDESWQCLSAFAHTLPNGDEIIDGRYHINGNATPLAFRKNVERLRGYSPSCVIIDNNEGTPTRIGMVHECMIWENTHRPVVLPDTVAKPDSLLNDTAKQASPGFQPVALPRRLAVGCGTQFNGWARLTLQNMKAGDQLTANGLIYICNGKSDEQACRRFTSGSSGYIEIVGPPTFSPDNLVSVEALELLPPDKRYHRPYLEDRNLMEGEESVVFCDDTSDEDETNNDIQ